MNDMDMLGCYLGIFGVVVGAWLWKLQSEVDKSYKEMYDERYRLNEEKINKLLKQKS